MDNPTTILILDSDSQPYAHIRTELQALYTVIDSKDAQEAEALCKAHQPTIVILNIEKTQDSSKAVIDKIKSHCEKHPSILCASSENTAQTRLATYRYGGDDLLELPLSIEETSIKLARLSLFHQQQRSLEANQQLASQTAMNAMIESSQYGGVLRFFNDMYQAKSTSEIKDHFFRLMQDFGLKTSIQFRTQTTETFDSTGKEPRPIELQVYDNMNSDGRLISFSSRLMVNGSYVSFIVKNMPTNDEMTTGRFQDILAVIIEGLDSKLTDLLRLTLLKQTTEEVSSSSDRLAAIMNNHEQFIVNAMNHVIGEINASFDVLDLTEAQEQFFLGIMERVLNSVEESFIHIGNEQDVLNCLWLSLKAVLGNNIKT